MQGMPKGKVGRGSPTSLRHMDMLTGEMGLPCNKEAPARGPGTVLPAHSGALIVSIWSYIRVFSSYFNLLKVVYKNRPRH